MDKHWCIQLSLCSTSKNVGDLCWTRFNHPCSIDATERRGIGGEERDGEEGEG